MVKLITTLWHIPVLQTDFFYFKGHKPKRFETSAVDHLTWCSLLPVCVCQGEFKVTERTMSMKELLGALDDGKILEVFGAGTACVVCPVGSLLYQGKVGFHLLLRPSRVFFADFMILFCIICYKYTILFLWFAHSNLVTVNLHNTCSRLVINLILHDVLRIQFTGESQLYLITEVYVNALIVNHSGEQYGLKD